jgi:rhodanese-related sulfurtransferase
VRNYEENLLKEVWSFLLAHWPLSLAFVLTLLAIIFNESRQRSSGGKRVSPTELTQLMNHENAVIVDIRESSDYIQGHILHAMNITVKAFNDHQSSLRKLKSRPAIVVDNNGNTVATMVKLLNQEGFTVYALAGGLISWRQEGLPLTTVNEN